VNSKFHYTKNSKTATANMTIIIYTDMYGNYVDIYIAVRKGR